MRRGARARARRFTARFGRPHGCAAAAVAVAVALGDERATAGGHDVRQIRAAGAGDAGTSAGGAGQRQPPPCPYRLSASDVRGSAVAAVVMALYEPGQGQRDGAGTSAAAAAVVGDGVDAGPGPATSLLHAGARGECADVDSVMSAAGLVRVGWLFTRPAAGPAVAVAVATTTAQWWERPRRRRRRQW